MTIADEPEAVLDETAEAGRTALYRLYSADDELLYIGISDDPVTRMGQHAGDKPWWSEVTRRTVVWYPYRAQADTAETIAVGLEQPKHNKAKRYVRLPEQPFPAAKHSVVRAMSTPGSVISLADRGRHISYRGVASGKIQGARKKLQLDRGGFAAYLSERVGWDVTPGAVARWEQGSVPPGDVLVACDGEVPAQGLLETVPGGFTADTLSGGWVTSYRFSDPPKFHADIAILTATSHRRARITNYAPRTQGHVVPFRNEIDAELAGRQLAGIWKNVSDACYFGTIHLVVLPGETVMEGYHTGLTRDGHVGTGFWKWVRIDPGSLEGSDLDGMTLRDPAELHALVQDHSQYDAPLSLTALGEVA